MPRSPKLTDERIDKILTRLAKGEPLAAICRTAGMPWPSQVTDFALEDQVFGQAYAKARNDGFDYIATDCLFIADSTLNDTFSNGKIDAEWVARSKIRIWTRLELLKMWDPKRYAAQITNKIVGDKEQPVSVTTNAGALVDEILTVLRAQKIVAPTS